MNYIFASNHLYDLSDEMLSRLKYKVDPLRKLILDLMPDPHFETLPTGEIDPEHAFYCVEWIHRECNDIAAMAHDADYTVSLWISHIIARAADGGIKYAVNASGYQCLVLLAPNFVSPLPVVSLLWKNPWTPLVEHLDLDSIGTAVDNGKYLWGAIKNKNMFDPLHSLLLYLTSASTL